MHRLHTPRPLIIIIIIIRIIIIIIIIITRGAWQRQT